MAQITPCLVRVKKKKEREALCTVSLQVAFYFTKSVAIKMALQKLLVLSFCPDSVAVVLALHY